MQFRAASAPHQGGTIKGLSKAPLHFQNMVAELIDNALSSKSQAFTIRVDLSPVPEGGDLYRLRVWDDGTGIPEQKLRTSVFTIGYPPAGTSHLNEHGFGLKNVLAKAEELTLHPWRLYTRDATALARGVFYYCERPYTFDQLVEEKPSTQWPVWGPSTTGTIVELALPLTFLQTVAVGRRGA